MKDEDKTKDKFIKEVAALRGRIRELEASETELKRKEKALRALTLADELTGLYNRRGFLILAQQQLKMANRMKMEMLLLFVDFDHLKRVNDTLGHHEGDLALIATANILKEISRESDIIARIGGDEFVVLAIETSGDSARTLTTRLQENLKAHNAKGTPATIWR